MLLPLVAVSRLALCLEKAKEIPRPRAPNRHLAAWRLPSRGNDPEQYEEEQSDKHIASVYIFEAGSAWWTGIEDCLVRDSQ